MNKTSTIWAIAAFCSMIILTALGIVTYGLVQKDRIQIVNAYEADRQGRIRLAMWRMDTLASSIMQEEDDRSAYEFNNPQSLPLPNKSLQNQANRLYYNAPETSNLYWNIVPSKGSNIISPQVYKNQYLIKNGIDSSQNLVNTVILNKLEDVLSEKISQESTQLTPYKDYKSLTCAAADVSLSQWGATLENAQVEYADENNDNYSYNYKYQALNKTSVQQQNEPKKQMQLSRIDQTVRAKTLTRIKNTKEAEWSRKQQETSAKQKDSKSHPLSLSNTKLNSIPPQVNTRKYQQVLEEPFSTPFTPIWIKEELMLVRKVTKPSGDIVQGIWINSEKLINKLLTEIEDLFPDATLIPTEQNIDQFLSGVKPKTNYVTMLKLPLQLQINEHKILHTSALSYFNGPIGLAWLGAIFAILASFFMLRSVLIMSERRASFVSSVTHELRTPLTTFRLYSDLLATGMVQDENKRQNYLGTLKHEADRLTHLVDNVLSYSQIEKGSAKAKIESISIASLMSRMESRLSERASEDLMLVNIIYSSQIGEQEIHVDITAVEQIIFNLVDNACKYASGEDYSDQLDIKITSTAKSFLFQVCDEGPGIDSKESKRLFRPFHKSAKEAADTKPGVGLGLALCRRLAKAMKGELSIQNCAEVKGACFQLKLPKS